MTLTPGKRFHVDDAVLAGVPMDDLQEPTPRYADPRVLLLNNELKKYAVSIVPILPDMLNLDPSAMGSGTCVRIGGRYFIATAAHVIMGRRFNQHFLLTTNLTNWSLRIVGGGVRGGGPADYLDVGWLELHGRAAALAERSWLDVARLRTHCVGDEDLVVFGSPQSDAERQTHPNGSPMLRANGGWWATRAITDARDLASEDKLGDSKMFLKWPRLIKGHNGEYYETGLPPLPWTPTEARDGLIEVVHGHEEEAPDVHA